MYQQMSLFDAPEGAASQSTGTVVKSSSPKRGNDEREVAALRRDLYQKGRLLGKELGQEAKERLGIPIYKLPREIVENWLRILDGEMKEKKQNA